MDRDPLLVQNCSKLVVTYPHQLPRLLHMLLIQWTQLLLSRAPWSAPGRPPWRARPGPGPRAPGTRAPPGLRAGRAPRAGRWAARSWEVALTVLIVNLRGGAFDAPYSVHKGV